MTAQATGGDAREGAKEGATFKAAGNPYKGVAMDMRKITEDSKPTEMELEGACPMIE